MERRFLDLGAATTTAHWIGKVANFTLGDGAIFRSAPDSVSDRIAVHDGAILAACAHPDREHLLSGGDDGRLVAVGQTGEVRLLLQTRGKWVDHIVASAASGVIVASAGKEATVLVDGQESHRFQHPSTIGGVALDQKGRRLAISHYGGVTLRYALAADDPGTSLKWAGSHLGVTISPDAAYVITAMQENALHGWRLPDKTDLRMDGYPAKTKSLSWDRRGRWLATSGADCAIVWPFVGKLGPQGKPPLELSRREALVTAVAFHPAEELLAIGYGDGAAVLARLTESAVQNLVDPGDGAVIGLAWRSDGKALAIGDEAGRGALLEF